LKSKAAVHAIKDILDHIYSAMKALDTFLFLLTATQGFIAWLAFFMKLLESY